MTGARAVIRQPSFVAEGDEDHAPFWTIPLTRGLVAMVSDEDFHLVEGFNWCAQAARNGKYFYADRNVKGVPALMHHALGFIGGDHINGDGLDNRRENLRQATRAQNVANRVMPKRGSKKASIYTGVGKRNQKWEASIWVGGKHGHRVYLGVFRSELVAALFYDRAVVMLRGEFAVTNFRQPGNPNYMHEYPKNRRRYVVPIARLENLVSGIADMLGYTPIGQQS